MNQKLTIFFLFFMLLSGMGWTRVGGGGGDKSEDEPVESTHEYSESSDNDSYDHDSYSGDKDDDTATATAVDWLIFFIVLFILVLGFWIVYKFPGTFPRLNQQRLKLASLISKFFNRQN